MVDDRLRTKLVVAGYEEELVWSWEHEELMARYAEVLVEGAKAKPVVPTPVPVDPALERERLVFEQRKWQADQEDKKLQREAEQKKWEADQDEKKVQKEEEKKKWEAVQKKWEADQEERKIA